MARSVLIRCIVKLIVPLRACYNIYKANQPKRINASTLSPFDISYFGRDGKFFIILLCCTVLTVREVQVRSPLSHEIQTVTRGRSMNILALHISDVPSQEGGNVVYRTGVYTWNHTSPRMVRIAANK